MLIDVVAVEVIPPYSLRLRFADGAEGDVDVAALVSFTGVFADLADPARFAEVTVSPDLGTIVWPTGADLDPDVLYAVATGTPIPDLSRTAA